MIDSEEIRVLLVEDNPGDRRLILEALAEVPDARIKLEHVDCLKAAQEILTSQEYDLILLDLSLPDSNGIETVEKTGEASPDTPIVILTGLDDVDTGIQAVRAGAQDYLVKGEVTGNLLVRAIRYAIERQQMRAALRLLSLFDDLTGLYNRRGFMTLAEHQMKLARRKHHAFYLIFADLDGMKAINDIHGHKEGDQALAQTAHLLRETFRGSDIVARMGGDEFAIVAIEPAASSAEQITRRFEDNIAAFNAKKTKPYNLSVSLGVVECNSNFASSLEEIMEQADELMYRNKAERKKEGR